MDDLVLACAVFALTVASAWLAHDNGQRSRRNSYAKLLRSAAAAQAPADIMKAVRSSRVTVGALAPMYRLGSIRRLAAMMLQAGVYAEVSEVLLLSMVMIAAGIMAGDLFGLGGGLSLTAGVVLGAIPIVYLKHRCQRRIAAFVVQLPYALDLIRSSLEAGHTLARAVEVLAKEFAEPLAGEFRAVDEQVRLGMPLKSALEEMSARVPVEDLRLLVVAVRVQSDVGSSLAQITGRLAEIIRMRQWLYAQVRTLTAQSRMSGMIVAALPAVVLLAFSLIEPGYAKILFTTSAGNNVLKAAATMDLFGLLTIRHLLRMDF